MYHILRAPGTLPVMAGLEALVLDVHGPDVQHLDAELHADLSRGDGACGKGQLKLEWDQVRVRHTHTHTHTGHASYARTGRVSGLVGCHLGFI